MWQWITNLPGSRRMAGDQDPFAGVDEEGLLEAVFPGRRRPAVAREQVPVGVVDVDHVGDVGLVDDLPGLGRAERREGVGAGGVEGPAVDHPDRGEGAADLDRPSPVGLLRDVLGPGGQRPQPARAPGSGRASAASRPGTASAPRRRAATPGPLRPPWRGPLRSSTESPARRRRSRRPPRPARPGPIRISRRLHRPRHQAAVGADLDHRHPVGEIEVVGAELRRR